MIKRGLLFGVLGFLMSFVTLFLYIGIPKPEEVEIIEPSIEESLSGWNALEELLVTHLREPVSFDDDIFVSILMQDLMKGITSFKRITITGYSNLVLWDSDQSRMGRKYRGWDISGSEEGVKITDTLLMIGEPITMEGTRVGYLYVYISNDIKAQDIAINGWKNYMNILAYSISSEVAIKDMKSISDISRHTVKRKDLLHFTVLSQDGIILEDIDKSLVGEPYKKGWIEKARVRSAEVVGNSLFISIPVNNRGNEVGEIDIMVRISKQEVAEKKTGIFGMFPPELTRIKNLIYPIVSFIILFAVGWMLGGVPTAIRSVTEVEAEAEEGVALSEERLEIEEELEKLKTSRDDLISEIAEKQKLGSELDKEIGERQILKGDLDEQVQAAEKIGVQKEEEEILFDSLLKEDKAGSAEQGREELELTQRIVAKRREEIALSARVEAKRKELIELERKADESKGGSEE